MTKTLVGYIAEIFDYTSPLPQITEDIIISAKRLGVLVLDAEDLFERYQKHNWRIIGEQRNYVPEGTDDICYRLGSEFKKVDFFGNVTEISENEAQLLPWFVPLDRHFVKYIIPQMILEPNSSARARFNPRTFTEIWGWTKKKRTLLRQLKAGHIFCFEYNKDKYCFGRLMAKQACGHIAEFFNLVSPIPEITAEQLSNANRIAVALLDSDPLFDKRIEGNWRIIGICRNYIPSDVNNIFFYFGVGNNLNVIDFFDRTKHIPAAEARKFPPESPCGDLEIKRLLADKIK